MGMLGGIWEYDGPGGQLDKKDQMPFLMGVMRRSHQLLAGGTCGFGLIFSFLRPVLKQISF